MKGTIDAAVPSAVEKILSDTKELAEHVTIVDLIRNDLSEVSKNVIVKRFRYLEEVRTNDKKLRKYRLALSCNAEYGNLFAGSGTDAQKKANILAQMNITMTRVNGVYEKDLAITMEIVPNNDLIIYFGSTSSDPWSGEFNTKTQQRCSSRLTQGFYFEFNITLFCKF